jgi:hypothetical protein
MTRNMVRYLAKYRPISPFSVVCNWEGRVNACIEVGRLADGTAIAEEQDILKHAPK